MTRINLFFWIAFLLMVSVGIRPALAQQGPSPLIGKIAHVYNPTPGQPVYIDIDGIENATVPAPGNWVSFTFPPTLQPHQVNFRIRNAYGQGTWWLVRTGLVTQGGAAIGTFTANDFLGGNEIWIIIDPAGPLTAPPAILTKAPKIINVLNPWPLTAPVLVQGAVKKGMRVLPDHCGWFTAFLLNPTDSQVYLQEIGGTDNYGKGGLGSQTPFDLEAEFAARNATTLWLDTDLNRWAAAFPGKEGVCRFLISATVRDFNADHPDFDFGNLNGDRVAPGRVEPALRTSDRRPVRSAVSGMVDTNNLFNDFESWWKTDNANADPALRSYETCADIPLSKSDMGLWEYDSYKTPERGFWPVENFDNPNNVKNKPTCSNNPEYPFQWTTTLPPRNMNFCMESHAAFIYRPGQKVEFRGDDDVWMFIDDKLVLDLGGVHGPLTDTVDLDKLGLTPGKEYKWDFFYCDRQPCGSSLRIKTSIFFRQLRALDTDLTLGPTGVVRARIIKRVGGTGSCSSVGDSLKIVNATNLIYKLLSADGTELEILPEGSSHGGGIIIATPDITVDTSKIVDLPPGNYRIVAYEPSNQGVRVEINFRVGPVSTNIRSEVGARWRPSKPPLHDVLGRELDVSKARRSFRKPGAGHVTSDVK